MNQVFTLFAIIFLGHWTNIPSYLVLPEIDSPLTGDVIRGSVVIEGTTDVAGFDSVEISYSYEDSEDVGENWFLIAQSMEPVTKGALAVWDTTMIADGDYRLRVMVILNNGSTVETTISNLRVRNYSPVETDIPGLSGMEDVPTPTAERLPTNTPKPVSTELSHNPARVTGEELRNSFVLGLSIVFGIAILFMLYTWLTRHRR